MTNCQTTLDINYQSHTPVLLAEVLDILTPKEGGVYFDGTFGAGGYSSGILSYPGAKLIAFDQDPAAAEYAARISSKHNKRFQFINNNFANIAELSDSDQKFDGMVLDLGVSSMQLDEGSRGFSFTNDGPLDMRMGNQEISAYDVVNKFTEEQISDIIYKYGEEPAARAIAKNIILARESEEIKTTFQLAELIRPAIRKWPKKIDPATKSFQAIRIFVNDEIGALESFLQSTKELLKDDGILVIVSFHSLEDSIVKSFFKENSAKKVARSKYAKGEPEIQPGKWLETLTRKPVMPSKDEISANIRARSAKLRAAKKIPGHSA